MQERHYKSILYFIGIVILVTLAMQVYWNYKNYQVGKLQLITDVQTSLDKALDDYYTQLAKENTGSFWASSTYVDSLNKFKLRTVVGHENNLNREFQEYFIKDTGDLESISIIKSNRPDSFKFEINNKLPVFHADTLRFNSDSTHRVSRQVELLSTKIMLSFTEDTLSLNKIDSLLAADLLRKNINIDYGLSYENHFQGISELRPDVNKTAELLRTSKSEYFHSDNTLKIYFSNITFTVLKKNILGILLSTLLLASVVGCLLYLLKIINRQKQLAEVKNDLISNITHEFKTPIATIGAAMEGIQLFNTENDSQKNLRYAKISEEQVDKLNGMVEKLLETATLDSERLSLNFEQVNLVDLVQTASSREIFSTTDKTITFETSDTNITYNVDLFHFENAINNVIDNAIKYGGNEIKVGLKSDGHGIRIYISDNGNSLSEIHKKQIFEKFYRVPKGNTHDVKGFGIGLYYTKKIIEKHKGAISLHTNGQTTFKITLPNEQHD